MQYVGKVGGYVYNQWNSLNPATLSGAIDIIVIEQPDGSLHCSPWHIRFGKFQIIKPLQKKIDVYVNGRKTDLPMKLGEGGEAFFVFEIDKDSGAELLSKLVLTSPVISASSSPPGSPPDSPRLSSSNTNPLSPLPTSNSITGSALNLNTSDEPDSMQLDNDADSSNNIEAKIKLSNSSPATPVQPKSPRSNTKIAFEKAKKITQKLNIPSKIDINGDMVLDMDGYKPNSQKNIDNSDELFNKIFTEEMENLQNAEGNPGHKFDENQWDKIISKDENGNIRIIAGDYDEEEEDEEGDVKQSQEIDEDDDTVHSSDLESYSDLETGSNADGDSSKTYFKTLRLTSEQMKNMNLHYGENQLVFKLHEGTSQTTSNLYLWKSTTPIVISDIDGTITKSDALGHVLNLIGRDWTHPGVANLFLDIKANGYNIMYLTARSAGQAEGTRQYLKNIDQDGHKLPPGPVILSPDRTMAALRREVILKKPEVFKMSCLSDIKNLYLNLFEINLNNNKHTQGDTGLTDDDRTPFYAGFGNRITDAISYRSVGIPSHRIFTINPDGEVHMELLELAGYRSSYLHIGELVDHFFPPLKAVPDAYWNDNQFNEYMIHKNDEDEGLGGFDPNVPNSPGSPDYDEARSINSGGEDYFQYPNSKNVQGGYNSVLGLKTDERYNDVNYWRDPLPHLSDLSDEEDDKDGATSGSSPAHVAEPKSPSVFSIRSFTLSSDDKNKIQPSDASDQLSLSQQIKREIQLQDDIENNKEKPTSKSAFSSPLKHFMAGGSNKSEPVVSLNRPENKNDSSKHNQKYFTPNDSMISKGDSDYTDEEDVDEDVEDDYSTEAEYDEDDDEEEDDDDYEDEDDYEDDEDQEEDGDEEDEEDEEDVDQELDVDLELDVDGDLQDGIPSDPLEKHGQSSPISLLQPGSSITSKKSQASLGLILEEDPKFIKASQLLNNLDLNK